MVDLVIEDIPYIEEYVVVAASSQTFNFTYIDVDDIDILLDGVLMTSGYSIGGNLADQGGYVGGTIAFAPAITGDLTIKRNGKYERISNILKHGVYDMDAINRELVQMMVNIQTEKPIDYVLEAIKDFDLADATQQLYAEPDGSMILTSDGLDLGVVCAIDNALGIAADVEYIYAVNDATMNRGQASINDGASNSMQMGKLAGTNIPSYSQLGVWYTTKSGQVKFFYASGWVTTQISPKLYTGRIEVYRVL